MNTKDNVLAFHNAIKPLTDAANSNSETLNNEALTMIMDLTRYLKSDKNYGTSAENANLIASTKKI